jgi:hypothetical protein
MQQFGVVFGVAVVTAVFNSHGSLANPASVTSGYRAALTVSAGASVLGALVAVGIRRARTAQSAPHKDDADARELAPALGGG